MYWGAGCLAAARRAGARVVFTAHDYHPLCARSILTDPHGSDGEGRLCSPAETANCDSCLAHLRPTAERAPGEDMATRLAYHRRCFEAAELVIAPSHTLERALVAARLVDPARIQVHEVGGVGEVQEPRSVPDDRALRLGYLGGLYHAKGVHVLVEAMRRLSERPLELHVHGPLEWFPDYVAALRERSADLPIHFHGRYPAGEAERILAELDVVVLPSLWPENRPLVLFEAWRAGLAVVASRIGGLAECVRHRENGLLFEPGDAADLARQLSTMENERGLLHELATRRSLGADFTQTVTVLEVLGGTR
jgi:glycosyltransferase involved in cell wall biosynthesis